MTDASLPLKPQESLTSSFISYDDIDEDQQNEREKLEKPFTITFPINRNPRNKQAIQVLIYYLFLFVYQLILLN